MLLIDILNYYYISVLSALFIGFEITVNLFCLRSTVVSRDGQHTNQPLSHSPQNFHLERAVGLKVS